MILDKTTAAKKMHRMAMEIAERNHDKDGLVFIGIRDNGIFIAQKMATFLQEVFDGSVHVIELKMDKRNPGDVSLSEAVDFSGKSVLLIDDVANSGRTMLYAMKPLLQFHPAQIETAVLVERTYKKFPVAVDYVGLSVATTQQDNIIVEVENGEVSCAYINSAGS